MQFKPRNFIAGCAVFGIAGIAVTTYMYGASWLVIGVGVVFGAGGWFVDRLTGFRIQIMGGSFSGVFVAVGGALLGYLWFEKIGSTLSQESPWPFGIQYTATVLLCYAVLMVIDLQMDKRHNKDRSASSRNV